MPSHEFTYPKVSPVVSAPSAHVAAGPQPVALRPVAR
jgi:hypothetical protein